MFEGNADDGIAPIPDRMRHPFVFTPKHNRQRAIHWDIPQRLTIHVGPNDADAGPPKDF